MGSSCLIVKGRAIQLFNLFSFAFGDFVSTYYSE